jgi:hypothetical protein
MHANLNIPKETQTMTQAKKFANEAVYVLQFNSRDAIKYIRRNANVCENTARLAFEDAVYLNRG